MTNCTSDSPAVVERCIRLMKLALPVLISQISLILVGFADNIMVGHYSTQALASASFVVNVFNIVLLCAMGFSYGLTPIIGMLYARSRRRRIGLVLRAGVYANLAVGVILTAIMGCAYFYLDRMGQPDELLPLIRPFYLIILSSVIFVSVFNAFAQWSFAIRNTQMPMWILLVCNLLNIVGNYMLIYGRWGAPELGLTGAGISTFCVRVLAAIAIMAVFLFSPAYREYKSGFRDRRLSVSRPMFGKVVATSWPVALQMSCETSAFSFCAVMAGWLETISLAAFQIIVIIGSLGFCVYYSIGTAIAVSVSNIAGASGLPACRRVAFDGYLVMLVFAMISTCIFIFFARPLMGLFTTDAEVLSMATGLVVPLALYQFGDATQVTFANALRGTSRVMPMLWIAVVSYVVVGLPTSWTLAFPLKLGTWGIVLSFSVSLFLAAALFFRSFMTATRR